MDKKELVTTICVQQLPTEAGWIAHLDNGSVFVEGREGWWDDVAKEKIKQISVMGLILPEADSYEFFREGIAVPGARGVAVGLTFKLTYESVILVYKFVVKQSKK